MRPFLLLAVVLPLSAADFPHQSSDLAVDPAVTWGKLANGLRYALMPNQQPKDKITLRLQVQAGSLQETEEQRGLAHFLEHMAFNGTTNYPPGQLVVKLQHLGLQFGAHTNAHTSFDETVYKLDLPDPKPETLATGLTVMADWAGGMLLVPAEVERERGVILAELRDRDGADRRIWEAVATAAYAGTKTGQRMPIGLPATIQAADQARLKDYFDTWYRPESMVLSVVGAIDPVAAEAAVKDRLSALADRAPARPGPDLTTLTVASEPTFVIRHEAESKDTDVTIERVMVEPLPADSIERQRDELRRELAERVYGRRIRAIVEQDADAPLASASAFSYHWLGFAHAGFQATARKGKAIAALKLAHTEYRRLLDHGPTDSELAVERRAIAAELDTAVAQAGARKNESLAQELYRATWEGRVVQSPTQRRDLVKPLLEAITAKEIATGLAAYRGRPGRDVIAITGREDLGAAAEASVQAAYQEVLSATVAAPTDRAVAAWAYGEPPDANGMTWTTESKLEAAAGVKVLERVKDGLRIQVRLNDAQPGQVLVSLRYDIPPTARPIGIGELVERGLIVGGLGRHPADEISVLFADSSVKLGGIDVAEDAVVLTASCKGDDLPRAMQLLRAYLTDPGWRSEAEPRVKQAWLEALAGQELDVEAQSERRMTRALVGEAQWRRPATADEVKPLGFAQAKTWLAGALAGAPLTVTVVGDAPADAADTVALWFGQHRASRGFLRGTAAEMRATLPEQPPVKPGIERLTVDGSVAKAAVHVVWPTDDLFDINRARRLNLVAQCLGERLRERIREQLGAAYSPAAWHAAGDSFRGQGQLHALVTIAPDQADKVLAIVREEAVAMAKDGVDDELLGRVKVPAVKSLAALKRRNEWWLGTVLAKAASHPFRLEWANTIEGDYQSVTATEISALAKRYLVDANVFAVVGVSPGPQREKAGAGEVP